MAEFAIALASFAGAAAALWTGFGLGTVLMPVLAVAVGLPTAIAATAAVHLVNSAIKAAWVGRDADRKVALPFCAVAIPSAALGAWLLGRLAEAPPLLTYPLGPTTAKVTTLKLATASIVASLALIDLPERWARGPFAVALGGALSGFFGGLSGHQGAFRSLFLKQAGLGRDALIGTLAVTALAIDLARLAVYGPRVVEALRGGPKLAWALAGALAGTVFAARTVRRWDAEKLRKVTDVLLVAFAALLALGVV